MGNEDLFKIFKHRNMSLTMSWKKKYNLAKAYYEHYGNLKIPQKFKTKNGYEYAKDGIALGLWISHQKQAYKGQGTYKITEEQIKLLEEIGMEFENSRNLEWKKKYNLAKAYYEHHGNLKISKKFKTKNGYEYAEDGIALGLWISHQKQAYKGQGTNKITERQIKFLEEIGMKFGDSRDSEWKKKYNLAKAYYKHYGNLVIPNNFKTLNGYEYNKDGVALDSWINNQKRAYKGNDAHKISEEQIELLEKIGLQFGNCLNLQWKKKYNLVKAYYEHYGNLVIPHNFKTLNGYEYDENGISLGVWFYLQKKAYISCELMEWQMKLLEKIELQFGNYEDLQWEKKYNLAKAYYEYYGNLDIPQDLKTINGYEYDENGIALGVWLSKQKQVYKGQSSCKMDEYRIRRLEEIGIHWYLNDKADDKAQKEIITKNNVTVKKIEILNRVRSYLLANYCDDSLPTKEDINKGMLDELNHVAKKKYLH